MCKHGILAGALVAMALLSSCGKKEESVPKFVADAEKNVGGIPASSSDSAPSQEFNVGDAETSIQLILELDPQSQSVNVTQQSVLNAKKELSEATVTVKDPNLANLWVRIRIKATQPFTKRIVALRGVIERDGQPIASFQTVLGAYATEQAPANGVLAPMSPREFRVDVLQGLTQRPASSLLFARTEVMLAPKGAVEKDVDPATLVPDPADLSAKISNPLRINFETPAAEPAPAAAAPAEAPAAPAAPAQ